MQLETVIAAFDARATAEEIAQQYASLKLVDVYAVISCRREKAFLGDPRADVRSSQDRVAAWPGDGRGDFRWLLSALAPGFDVAL